MKCTLIIFLISTFGGLIAMGRSIPLGERKYVIPEAPAERVQIVNESERVKGNFMRDPIGGSKSDANKTSGLTRHKIASERHVPSVVHTEKTFRPMNIEGKLLMPRVEFQREFLDIAQLEAISQPKFAERLIENLDGLDDCN